MKEMYYEVHKTWETVSHENGGFKVGNDEKTVYRIKENADGLFKNLREEELEKIKAIQEFGSHSATVTADDDRRFMWYHHPFPGRTTTHTVEILTFEFAD